MYNTREEMINILSYFDYAKLCNVIKYFPKLDFLCERSYYFLSPINFKSHSMTKIILINYNYVWIKLMQERIMTSQFIKVISRET